MIHEPVRDIFVRAERRNLPNRILRAIDNALHLGGLANTLRPTLAEICRFVPQARPFDTVFARKQKIAERTGLSERSIYRHLKVLQRAGLIEITEQERKSRNGRFSISRIRLTRLAAELLGLIAVETDHLLKDEIIAESSQPIDTPPGNLEEAASINLSVVHSAEKPFMHSPPTDNLAVGHILTKPTFTKNQPQPTKNGLPLDLSWLTSHGISRAGVFKLMGLAKNNKKRLSDIVVVVKDRLVEMRGGRLYAYLAALSKGPSDFSSAAIQERSRISTEQNSKVFQQQCRWFRERFRGTSLTDATRTRLFKIDEQAKFVWVIGAGPVASVAPLNDLSTWISAIQNGKLVLATLDVEKRFPAH